jgi:hypothetical protein
MRHHPWLQMDQHPANDPTVPLSLFVAAAPIDRDIITKACAIDIDRRHVYVYAACGHDVRHNIHRRLQYRAWCSYKCVLTQPTIDGVVDRCSNENSRIDR